MLCWPNAVLLGPLLVGSFFIHKSNLASANAPRLLLVFPTLRPQAAIFHTALLFLNLVFAQKGSHYTRTWTHGRTLKHTQQLSSLPLFLHNEKSTPHPLFQLLFLGVLCPPPSVNRLLHCHAQQALPHTQSHPQPRHSPLTGLSASHLNSAYPPRLPDSSSQLSGLSRCPAVVHVLGTSLGHQAAKCLVSNSFCYHTFHYRAGEN